MFRVVIVDEVFLKKNDEKQTCFQVAYKKLLYKREMRCMSDQVVLVRKVVRTLDDFHF